MGVPDRLSTRPWLAWARAGIILVALACAGLFLVSLYGYYTQVQAMNPSILPSENWTPESFRLSLQQAGETPAAYAAFHIVLVSILTAGYLGMAALLLARKAGDRMALILALTLVTFATGFPPPIHSLKLLFPAYAGLVEFWSNLAYFLFFQLFYLFPDGKFTPRWTRYLALFWAFATLVGPVFPRTVLDVMNYPEPWATLLALAMFSTFIAAQVFRFRRVSTPLQRQQTKWVVAGMVAVTLVFIVSWFAGVIYPPLDSPGLVGLAYEHIRTVALAGGFFLVPLSMGIAIFRYRLFDIDLIIRRTLTYTLLTALIAALYVGSVVMLQQLMGGIVSDSPAALVISTLLIATVFAPLRRRIQAFIDRRFYRDKYDAEKALAGFATAARSETDLGKLSAHLVDTIQSTFHPELVTLWVPPDGRPTNPSSASSRAKRAPE